MNIRTATANDIDQIWELGSDVTEFETSPEIVSFWPKSILKDCVDKKDVLIKIAEDAGKIIGFFIVNINHSMKKGELENMFVSPNYRRQGIGAELLKQTISDLEKVGIENIIAMSDDAVDFLVAHGFDKGKKFYWMDLVLSQRYKEGDL